MKKGKNIIERKEYVGKLAKSMYKAVKNYLETKDDAKEIVDDILDDNFIAEVDPDEVASGKKVNILEKNEDNLLNRGKKKDKGVDKLKKFLKRKSDSNSNL